MTVQLRRATIELIALPDGRIQTRIQGKLGPAEVVFALQNLIVRLCTGEMQTTQVNLPTAEELRRRLRGE